MTLEVVDVAKEAIFVVLLSSMGTQETPFVSRWRTRSTLIFLQPVVVIKFNFSIDAVNFLGAVNLLGAVQSVDT